MCSRSGDSSLVIPIFWIQESHKGGSTWESWILIGDWEIIGDRSGGQVQCIFMLNFRGHTRVGRVATAFFLFFFFFSWWGVGGDSGGVAAGIVSYLQYWSYFFCCFTLMSPKLHYHWAAGDLFLCLWKYFVGTMNQGCLSDPLSTWNILHQQTLLHPGCCRNRIFYMLPVQLCQGRTRCNLAINSN